LDLGEPDLDDDELETDYEQDVKLLEIVLHDQDVQLPGAEHDALGTEHDDAPDVDLDAQGDVLD